MAKEFVGNSANLYLLPITVGKGEAAAEKIMPMAELILLTIEPDYVLDEQCHITKTQTLDTLRVHISLSNIGRLISGLTDLQEELQAFAIQTEQQRAGVDPAQMSLPGV